MTYARKALTITIALILLFSVAASPAMTASLVESVPSQYTQFFGTIESIEYFLPDMLDLFNITLIDESGKTMVFAVSWSTYIPENTRFTVGNRMVAVYDLNDHVAMINQDQPSYPLPSPALVMASAAGIQGVKVERFDKNLLSADGELKLLPGDYPVFFRNGIAYEGELNGCLLAVFHSVVMPSFPAQTTPDYIVVLTAFIWLEDQVIINGEPINVPRPYINDQSAVMTPVKAIAEALGYTYNWDETAQTVILDKGITMTIGSTEYNYMRMAPIYLDTAPEMRDGVVYAPLSFYSDVLRLYNVDLIDKQVVIEKWFKEE